MDMGRKDIIDDNIVELNPWETVKFQWGSATRHRKGRWDNVTLDGVTIDVSDLDVLLTEERIGMKDQKSMEIFAERYKAGMEGEDDKEEKTD